jgi:hypothetical protein
VGPRAGLDAEARRKILCGKKYGTRKLLKESRQEGREEEKYEREKESGEKEI